MFAFCSVKCSAPQPTTAFSLTPGALIERPELAPFLLPFPCWLHRAFGAIYAGESFAAVCLWYTCTVALRCLLPARFETLDIDVHSGARSIIPSLAFTPHVSQEAGWEPGPQQRGARVHSRRTPPRGRRHFVRAGILGRGVGRMGDMLEQVMHVYISYKLTLLVRFKVASNRMKKTRI